MLGIKPNRTMRWREWIILVSLLFILTVLAIAALLGGFSSILTNGRTLCLDCIGIF